MRMKHGLSLKDSESYVSMMSMVGFVGRFLMRS